MKKLFALLLTGILAFSMAACKGEPEINEAEAIEAMAAPLDAMARCMLENDLTYAPDDPEFFWSALYYFTSSYSAAHPQVTQEEGSYQLKIPTPVMEEHAAALFADYDDLFPLPSIMKGNISYDPEADAYFVSRGDIGLSEIRLSDITEHGDGYTLTAQLWDIVEKEEHIASFSVTLAKNACADGIEEPMYLFSISDMTLLMEKTDSSESTPGTDTPNAPVFTTDTALFNGLADSHTAELTLSNGEVQAFQFDPASDIAKVMGSLKEGDGITIGYGENKNGGLEIFTVE